MTAPARLTQASLMSEDQAAAYLLMSARTLREIRQRGAIRYIRLSARKIAYRIEDCDEYVAAHARIEPAIPAGNQPKGKPRKVGQGNVVPFSQRRRQ